MTQGTPMTTLISIALAASIAATSALVVISFPVGCWNLPPPPESANSGSNLVEEQAADRDSERPGLRSPDGACRRWQSPLTRVNATKRRSTNLQRHGPKSRK